MNTAVALRAEIPSLALTETELCKVLESSVYPGADLTSIKMVIGVCRAAHLDPLQKPYHIVPMDVKRRLAQRNGNKEFEYVKQDVVMPGIGLYRIQAERSGEYAGISAPTFGDMKKLKWTVSVRDNEDAPEVSKEFELEYPDWCEMTVRRMVNGTIVEFTHREYWIENYATKGKNSKQPNAMWEKRPRGQIVKCTEAQCLRKAFPSIGAQPTAEELEGKTLDVDTDGNIIDGRTGQVVKAAIPPLMQGGGDPGAVVGGAVAGGEPKADQTQSGGPAANEPLMSEGERANLKKKLEAAALTETDLKAKFGVGLAELKAGQFKAVKDWIKNPSGA